MKKYLLTALLGVFACIGFASADTVGNFTSDSSIGTYNFNGYFNVAEELNNDYLGNQSYYYCLSSSDIPYYFSYNYSPLLTVSSSVYCSSQSVEMVDGGFIFCPNAEVDQSQLDNCDENISGTLYYSASPITYSAPSGGNGGNSGGLGGLGNNGGILSGGFTTLGNVLSGLSTTINEFIPYMVYIGLGILIVTLGFIAVKWLVNRVSKRVTSIFSSKRRK